MSKRRFPLWTLFGVVVVIALIAGSGVLSASPPTAAQRADAIESVVRCPSCEDLSVAQSSASTAVVVRATVANLIAEGRTDQQIENFLVARYGSSIVLDPPARGVALAVWVLPLLGGALAVVTLATLMVRRRSSVDRGPAGGVAHHRADAVSVTERRRFLDRSLADADAEYLAGDLSDHDYLALRRRDLARLAALDLAPVEEPLAVPERIPMDVLLDDAPVPARATTTIGDTDGPDVGSTDVAGATLLSGRLLRSPRSRRSWWFLWGAVACFGAALIVAVSLSATDRLPGQTATGSVSLSQSRQTEETLAQAATDQDDGQLGQAAQLYQSVLAAHPDNEVALAQLGWLEYETGHQGNNAAVISDGRMKLDRAVKLDPGDYAARLYLGTLLLQHDGNAAGAVDQYRLFLADRPPTALVDEATPEISEAFQRAGLPLPSALAAGG